MPWLWPSRLIHPALAIQNTARMAAHRAAMEVNSTAKGSRIER